MVSFGVPSAQIACSQSAKMCFSSSWKGLVIEDPRVLFLKISVDTIENYKSDRQVLNFTNRGCLKQIWIFMPISQHWLSKNISINSHSITQGMIDRNMAGFVGNLLCYASQLLDEVRTGPASPHGKDFGS